MNRNAIKFTAFALTGAVLIAGTNLVTSATGVAAVLPVAGLSLTLGEGTSVNKIKEEVENKKIENVNVMTVSNNEAAVPEESQEVTVPDSITPEDGIVKETETSTEEVGTETSTEEVSEEITTEEASEEETENEDKYFSTLVIAKVNDYVNVRSIPSEEGEIVGKLYDKSVGEFVSEKDGWYEITSGSVTGFVKAEYVVTGEDAIALAKEVGHRMATVTTETLYVREQPTTESSVLGMVPLEDQLTVLEEVEGWIKVSIEEGEGYVSGEFVTLSTEFVKAESKAEEEARKKKEEQEREAARAAASKASQKANASSDSKQSEKVIAPVSSGSGMGSSVANFAVQFVGNPYVYGGTSLTNGADCSGFVMSVYNNFGVGLPHSSGAQRGRGTDVGGLQNAQPGDIVCYSGHVGIYIGGGNIVHASTAKTGIKISNANYRPILSVRRIF